VSHSIEEVLRRITISEMKEEVPDKERSEPTQNSAELVSIT
jgi:hypothetical protein